MSAYLVRRIEEHPLVSVRLRTEVRAVHAEAGRLAGLKIAGPDGRQDQRRAQALFVCIGGEPRTTWTADKGIRTDAAGYIVTGADLLLTGQRPEDWPIPRDPLPLETSVPGLFAAGDARHGSIKRVAAAVGEGSMAVALPHRRLDELAVRPRNAAPAETCAPPNGNRDGQGETSTRVLPNAGAHSSGPDAA